MHTVDIAGKRLLHFFPDGKVVNDAIECFESVFPNESIFIILSNKGKALLTHNHPNTFCLSYNSKEIQFIIKNCISFQEIICHSLWPELDRIVVKLHHPNVSWIIWGADLFEDTLYWNGYKLYFDEKLLFKIRAQRMPVWFFRLMVNIRDRFNYYYHIKAIKCVNNICYTAAKDLYLLTTYVNLGKDYIGKEFFYYPIEKMLGKETMNKYVSGVDIWINNAAGYNGNHIEVFNRIKGFNIKGAVHVPLSYGIKKYGDYVETEGIKLFGDSFDPMTSFMPREDYYNKFLNSNSFIFGHLRGCATGNVVVALYLGAKVFLFKQNVLYDFFKDKGVVLFSIEEDLTENSIYEPLPDDLRLKNRNIILEFFSSYRLLSIIKSEFHGI